MVEACRRPGVPLFVAYYRRALPRFLKVERLLAPTRSATPGRSPSRCAGGTSCQRNRRPGASTRQSPVAGGSSIWRRTRWICSTSTSDRSRRPRGAAVNQGGHYCGGRSRERGVRVGERCAGERLWCFTAHGAVDRTEIIGHAVASRMRPSTIGRSCSRRRAETETLTIPHPAARAAAAHPDRRRTRSTETASVRAPARPPPARTGDGPAASLVLRSAGTRPQESGARDQGLGTRDYQ